MPNITSTQGLVKLTDQEFAYLSQFLTAGDRPGFYLSYYNMTGSAQALEQAQISSFSGAIGGIAYVANRILQDTFEPKGQYKGIYFLSQAIAEQALSEIAASRNAPDGTGYVTDETMFQAAQQAWADNGQADQFPGNLLAWNEKAIALAKQASASQTTWSRATVETIVSLLPVDEATKQALLSPGAAAAWDAAWDGNLWGKFFRLFRN